ncbi:unnamed protein product [Wuchereria bancrofti]|uniref:Uncharacterized protein n=1 Tax=Wuchereria bancrofti TaxID=6293 RepID=A0A3P7EBX5_WUCBA|nr:unnamed protein product [Wuchereria bancrofti]
MWEELVNRRKLEGTEGDHRYLRVRLISRETTNNELKPPQIIAQEELEEAFSKEQSPNKIKDIKYLGSGKIQMFA